MPQRSASAKTLASSATARLAWTGCLHALVQARDVVAVTAVTGMGPSAGRRTAAMVFLYSFRRGGPELRLGVVGDEAIEEGAHRGGGRGPLARPAGIVPAATAAST